MLDSFRRFAKSKVGTGILVVLFVAVLASFALNDLSGVKNGGLGLTGSALAKAGGREVTDRDVTLAMEQLLNRARQQNPSATGADVAADFDPLVESLIQGQTLLAFGDRNGLDLSKRLFDAEIARLPAAQGLDGKVNDSSYQAFLAKQRMTDAELRRLIASSLAQKLLLAPVAANARLTLGLAAPYAAMLMEQREGELALIPVAAFTAGLKPSDTQLAAYYGDRKARYVVPEQRSLRIARFGPADVAAVTPSEQDIATYYNANRASYAAKEVRTISQAIVPDAKVAGGIASRARAGQAFAAAAQPAGLSAGDVSLGPQTRDQFKGLAGESLAATAFGPAVKAGTIIGPVQSDLGWHVIRIDAVTGDAGKTLAAAHAEIAAKLTIDKRKTALGDLVDRVQNALDGGESFADVVTKNRLTASETPLLTAQGTARADPAYKLPAEMAGALKSGFELTGQDAPVIETLPGDAGFALVALGKQLAAAPAPLTQVRDQVARDWIAEQAFARARSAADRVAASASAGTPLGQAVKAAGVNLPPPRPVVARRIELQKAPPTVADALKALFALPAGKSRMVTVPSAQAFAVVSVAKITPGNAMVAPGVIAQVQREFQRGATEEYARQFLGAIGQRIGVKRNASAIAATRQRLTSSPNATE